MKTLINKIRKGVKKGILVATAVASLGLGSCNLCVSPSKPNLPPKISEFYANPPSGEVPLTTEVTVIATDNYGEKDILKYELAEDKNSNNEIDSGEEITNSSSQLLDYPVTFNTTGTKKLLSRVTDTQNQTDKKSIEVIVSDVPIVDYLDVEGWLQDNETDTGKQGIVKILDSTGTLIGQTQTDNPNGHFVFHSTDKKISDLSGVVLKAISTDSSNIQNSYVRTKTFPAGDVTVNPIRVVPYETGWTSTEINNFIEHMRRVNFWNGGLQKWNHGELPDDALTTYSHPLFKGIEISNNFSTEEQDKIENAIRDSGYLKEGEVNIVRGENHYLELGWGFVRLSIPGEAPGTIVYEQYGSDGYIERFVTNLTHLQATDKGLANHEIDGHGMLYPGHADSDTVAALFNSIMKYTSYDNRYSPPERPDMFTPIDIKGNYLIDDPTNQGMEPENNILGTTF